MVKINIGRLIASYNFRPKSSYMGRFGGGWNWQLGVDISAKTMIINCLVFYLRFDIVDKKTHNIKKAQRYV